MACSLVSVANEDERINSRFTEEAPKIDGILDDKVWQEAQSVTGFKTFAPDFEKDMDETFKMVQGLDSGPKKILVISDRKINAKKYKNFSLLVLT